MTVWQASIRVCHREVIAHYTHTHTHCTGSRLTAFLGFHFFVIISSILMRLESNCKSVPLVMISKKNLKSMTSETLTSSKERKSIESAESIPSCFCLVRYPPPPFCPPFPLNSNNPAHRYYLATDPVTGQLYVSDTNSRRIYRPKMLSGARDLISKNALSLFPRKTPCLQLNSNTALR